MNPDRGPVRTLEDILGELKFPLEIRLNSRIPQEDDKYYEFIENNHYTTSNPEDHLEFIVYCFVYISSGLYGGLKVKIGNHTGTEFFC